MTKVDKFMLLHAIIFLPLMWFIATMAAGAITLYHGYAIYFIYFMLLLTLIAIIWALMGKVSEGPCLLSFIFSAIFILSCIAFNVYGLVVLFFPQWNGWNGWTPPLGYVQVYFQLPQDFNYASLLVFLGLMLIYGGKKFFELDMDAMKKHAYKKKEVVQDHVYYIKKKYNGNYNKFEVIFKPRFLVKSEHWLHAAGIGFCCYVILPFNGIAGGLGSSMARFGNNSAIATAIFICGYFFLYACVYILIQAYGSYRLFRTIEKELGVKLKPVLQD